MAKKVNDELVLLALCQVVWAQAQKLPLEQYARPVRPVLPHDPKVLTQLLVGFRKVWAGEIARQKQTGESSSFEMCKRAYFNEQKKERSWTQASRNLYSSALSVYMNWDRDGGKIAPATKAELKKVANLLRFQWEYKHL